MTIKQMTTISLFTTLMIVFTISFPHVPVPILDINVTLQTLVVMITGMMLRPKDAFISMLLYLIIGALGFPVFSNFQGGIAFLIGPKGGFYFSFPIAALLISIFNQNNRSFYKNFIVNSLFGILFVYLIGVIWLDYYLATSFIEIMYTMLIFIPFDIVKCFIASLIEVKVRHSNLGLMYYQNKL